MSQVQQFLASQYGTISITTSTGTPVYSTSWTQGGSGDGTWSPIAPRQLQDRRGTVVNGYATDWRSPNLILPTGQYTLSLDLGLAQGVNDGYGAASPGSWLNITACSFTVQ